MNKKNLIVKVIISVCMVVALIWASFYVFKPFTPECDGKITVEVVDLDNNVIKSKEIEYYVGERLRDLVQKNFDNFKIEESEYGAYVIGIESIFQDNDAHIYIALYYNGEYSNDGLDTLAYEDGSVITFKAETW